MTLLEIVLTAEPYLLLFIAVVMLAIPPSIRGWNL